MKRIITLLLLTSITTNLFGMEYLKSLKSLFQHKVSEQAAPVQSGGTELNNPIKARVEVIYLTDPIDFQQTALKLVAAAKNNQISGVILIIESCGGAAGSFSVLHDLIKKVSTIKPIVALVNAGAYSGGYMITSAANYIFAHSFSELGSIGVVAEITKFKDAEVTGNIKAKIDVELFTAGEFKALSNCYKKLSEEDRAYIQQMIDEDYQHFLTLVSEDRNLNRDEYKNWAEAKVFIAPQALKLGLIDEIGTIFDAEAKILELIRQRNPDKVFDNDMVTNLLPAGA